MLEKTVASEGNVAIYESYDINIFDIMTNFKLETSTDDDINSLPLDSPLR